MQHDPARVMDGELTAPFEDFYRRHRLEVTRATVLVLGDRELGQEAVDEAFARALERWDEVAAFHNPAGWVYRVAVNWGRSRLRRGLWFSPDAATWESVPFSIAIGAIAAGPGRFVAVGDAPVLVSWSPDGVDWHETGTALELDPLVADVDGAAVSETAVILTGSGDRDEGVVVVGPAG